jgi:hypothetical protein
MIVYGFEVEGFLKTTSQVVTPASTGKIYPVDGFPGLVELRTHGYHYTPAAAWGAILTAAAELPGGYPVADFGLHQHKFTADDMAYMRKHARFDKRQLEVLNLYGKKPRRLGNTTIASFQINVSNLLAAEKKEITDGKLIHTSARYGLLDVAGIVRRLDVAFADEIKRSGRQPGMYAIKDDVRLEYRSLPNFVFPWDVAQVFGVLGRIEAACKGS